MVKNKPTGFFLFIRREILLGFFNWETFAGPGRSGFRRAIAYPSSIKETKTRRPNFAKAQKIATWISFAIVAVATIIRLALKTILNTA